MKRIALAAAAAIALTGSAVTAAQTTSTHQPTRPSKPPVTCLLPAFKDFSAKVWAPRLWERGAPKHSTVEAAHHRIGCAPAGHRKAMKRTWRTDRRRYGRYRELRLVAPYPGGGTYWAIPYYIVYCESRGEWTAANPSGALGPYQLLGWGAPYPATTWKAKMENHRIAAGLWAGGAGASNWVCA